MHKLRLLIVGMIAPFSLVFAQQPFVGNTQVGADQTEALRIHDQIY